MIRGVGCAVALCVAAVALAACTSSGPAARSTSPSTPAPSTPTTVAPSTPAPSTTTSAPLSRFESDPAVAATRTWTAQAARTVNTGHYTDAKLAALMTPTLAKTMKNVLGSDVGLYYPGPVPFTPVSVRIVSATERRMQLCFIGTGFAEKRSTHRPAAALKVLPIDAAAVQSGGRWRVSAIDTASNFSCRGVAIARRTW